MVDLKVNCSRLIAKNARATLFWQIRRYRKYYKGIETGLPMFIVNAADEGKLGTVWQWRMNTLYGDDTSLKLMIEEWREQQ
jgi:hypothetical protein